MIPETGKKYIITTENAVDPHGLTVLHVSEIKDSTLAKVEEDEDWSAIKTIMRAIISGNVGSYQYLALMTKAKIDGQYSRDISVSSSAAKQMTDNYNAADKLETGKVEDEVPTVEEPKVDPATAGNSIFPESGAKPTEENEISPGIADVAKPVMPVASPQTVEAALPEDTDQTAAKPAQVVATDQVAAAIQSVPVQVVQQVQPVQQIQPVQQVQQPYQVVTQQSMPVNQVIDASQMVRQQYGVMDNGLNTQISTMGVAAGYGTVAPIDNQAMYGYQQPMMAPPNLDYIVNEVQEAFAESIRNLVYSVYDKVQNEAKTQQIIQQQIGQPLQQLQSQIPNQGYSQQSNYGVQQPVMGYQNVVGQQQGMVNPYVQPGMYQPMIVQASNDVQ